MWIQNKKMFKPRRGKRVLKQCRYKENRKEIVDSSKKKNKNKISKKKERKKEKLALFEVCSFS